MQNKKQIISNSILFIILIAITFILIFKNHDFAKTINLILSVDIKYIILAIIAMSLNIVFESINIKNVLESLGIKTELLKTIKYTLIGFFFSGITPAAGGGQPMEIYYMNKDKIPVASSTISLLIELCSYHFITIILGIIGLIINYNIMTKEIIWIFIIGITLKTIVLLFTIIALFSKRLSNLLVSILINILEKIKYHNIDKVKENVTILLTNYEQGSIYIKQHKNIFFKSLLLVSFQVIAYYSVTYFIYRSFGLNYYNLFKIISIQALLFVSVSSIPLPGSVGISESAFLKIYMTIFNINILPSAMLLSRGINFYLFILISLVIVVLNSLRKNKNI